MITGKEIMQNFEKLKKEFPDFPKDALLFLASHGFTITLVQLKDGKNKA